MYYTASQKILLVSKCSFTVCQLCSIFLCNKVMSIKLRAEVWHIDFFDSQCTGGT